MGLSFVLQVRRSPFLDEFVCPRRSPFIVMIFCDFPGFDHSPVSFLFLFGFYYGYLFVSNWFGVC